HSSRSGAHPARGCAPGRSQRRPGRNRPARQSRGTLCWTARPGRGDRKETGLSAPGNESRSEHVALQDFRIGWGSLEDHRGRPGDEIRYRESARASAKYRMTKVFIISAPSGSGKSTLVKGVRRVVPGLKFSISYTTRAPRGSEKDGCEYFFVSRSQFEDMIARGEFLEHADVFGNYYGNAKRFLSDAEQSGQDLLLDIDVQGAA